MKSAKLLSALLLGIGILASGCGPQWAVVKQSTPNPFIGQKAFLIEPIKFDGMLVGKLSEADYLAKKKPDQQASFVADKTAMNERFAARLTELAAKNGLTITPVSGTPGLTFRTIVSFLEPGYYAPTVGTGFGSVDLSRPTQVRANVQLIDAQGAVLEDIAIAAEVKSDLIHSASGTRYRNAAEILAEKTHMYLINRTGPAKK